jgi:hypothetical protein
VAPRGAHRRSLIAALCNKLAPSFYLGFWRISHPRMLLVRTEPRPGAPGGPLGCIPAESSESGTFEPLALPTGPLKAGADSLLDHGPFELGKDLHHAE